MDFTQWLQTTMTEHNLTVYQISKISGVHQSTIANWMAGAKPQEKKRVAVINSVEQYLSKDLLTFSPALAKKPVAYDGDGLTERKKQMIELIETMDEKNFVRLEKLIQALME